MKYLIIFIFVYFQVFSLYSQSKKELENRKQVNYKNIKITNELLEKTKHKKSISYNHILLLHSKIKSRENIINSIKDEVNIIDDKIIIHQDIVIDLKHDLEILKKEYAKMVYYSFLNNDTYSSVMFILAADNFNMGYKRLKYYQQYTKHRKKQAKLIEYTKQKIHNELISLEIIRAQKNDLLLNEQVEKQNLSSEKEAESISLNTLKAKEGELKLKLKKQYKIAKNLQREIEKIIEEEARLAANRSTNKSPDFFKLTPEEKLISQNIAKNKHSLPWPTKRGVVIVPFGENPHDIYKDIMLQNNGIDIATFEGAAVRAVFDGVVSRVFVLPGMHKTVIIRHGNFLTVYSNLKDVIVQKGDKVSTKQTIGIVYTDSKSNNKTVLKFQIWKENIKMNPEEWLAKGKNG